MSRQAVCDTRSVLETPQADLRSRYTISGLCMQHPRLPACRPIHEVKRRCEHA